MTKPQLGYAWRPDIFLYCYLTAAALALSLVWTPSSDLWVRVDEATYYLFNGSLNADPFWAKFWGYLNVHEANYAAGAFMVLILGWYFLFTKDEILIKRLSAVTAVVLMVGLGVIVAKTGFRDFERYSPSLTLTPFVDLNLLVDGIRAKTQSRNSFPGDHGVTTIIYSSLVILLLKSRSLVVLATLFALANNLPRLFGGAHWLSDVIVGGGAISLAVVPFALGTPFLKFIETLAEPILRKLKTLF
ncbi:MAG: phosphatase PAP2 family protein [Sneathiella sp.]